MTYIEGFVIAVPTANKQKFIAHANVSDSVFMEHGATSVLECWQEDVPCGKTTDFYGAVDARDDESIVFSWIEWPDKATRSAMEAQMGELMQTDDRFNPEKNPMPFDGKRMIYGGFQPIVEEGAATPGSYVQGFILAVPAANQEAYRKMAQDSWPMFQEFGALRLVECWDDDVPAGKLTDFRRAVKAEADEKVVFSIMEWPSREACDKGHERMMQDERMQTMPEMPFDTKRMVFGGFSPIVAQGGGS